MRKIFNLNAVLVILIVAATFACIGAIVFLFLPGEDYEQQSQQLRTAASVAVRKGAYAEAEKLAKAAVDRAEQSGDKTVLAATLTDLSEILRSENKYREAEATVRHALSAIVRHSLGTGGRLSMLQQTTDLNLRLAAILGDEGKNEQAIAIYNDALNGSQAATLSLNDKTRVSQQYAQLLEKLGRMEESEDLKAFSSAADNGLYLPKAAFEALRAGHIEEAKQKFRAILRSAEKNNDATNKALALTMMGVCKFGASELKYCKTTASSALELTTRMNTSLDRSTEKSRALTLLAVCDQISDNKKEAQLKLQEALTLDWDTCRHQLCDIMQVCSRTGQTRELAAIETLLYRTLPQCKLPDLGVFVSQIVACNTELGRKEAALQLLLVYVEVLKRQKPPDANTTFATIADAADVAMSCNKYDTALTLFKQSLSYYARTNNTKGIDRVTVQLAKLRSASSGRSRSHGE